MSRSTSPIEIVAIYGVVAVMIVLVRKGRRDPAAKGLPKGQRVRPLALEFFDPILSMVLVGPLLVHELGRGAPHVLAALLGAVLGIPIGLARAKVMFVTALPATTSVVLTRSAPEYVLLGLLLILRTLEQPLSTVHSSAATLALAALLALAVGESFVRAGGIIWRYRSFAAGGSPDQRDERSGS